MKLHSIASADTLAFAKTLIASEQARHSVLEAQYSAAEWHVLLELFVAIEEGRTVAVSDMGLIEGIPRSTALGIVADMTRRGLVLRHPDRKDGRRFFLSLETGLHQRIDMLLRNLMVLLRHPNAQRPDR